EDAQALLKKLSELPEEREKKRRFRLPTEAEWEYACRGGPRLNNSTEPFYFVEPSGTLDSVRANFEGSKPYGTGSKGSQLGRTEEVGKYPKNPLGLCDMHGNVCEWCQDFYGPYAALKTNKDPLQDERQQKALRVLRGGSWGSAG